MAGEREQLLAQAAVLDKQALEAGETGPRGRELRRQPADLRRQALGPGSYRVLICSSCFHLTGSVTIGGECDLCARRDILRASYANPHGGFVDVTDTSLETRVAHASPSG